MLRRGQRRRRQLLSLSGDNVVSEEMIEIIAKEHLLPTRRHVDAQLDRVNLLRHEKVLAHVVAALLRAQSTLLHYLVLGNARIQIVLRCVTSINHGIESNDIRVDDLHLHIPSHATQNLGGHSTQVIRAVHRVVDDLLRVGIRLREVVRRDEILLAIRSYLLLLLLIGHILR